MPTLLIYKNTSNIICPTLTEKTTLSPVSYVFRIKGDVSNDYTYVTSIDVSTETQRYNQFTITETDNPNMLSAEISLSVGGYLYEAFEVNPNDLIGVTDLADLNYNNLTLVESGVMQCKETTTADTEYPAVSTNTQYEPS
jgi:hypothetical protein